MALPEAQANVEWREGRVPVSTRFDDPYFSLQDGLAETAHVFLTGNALPARFAPGFRVAELGFGTGLNALAAAALWRQAGIAGRLRFTSFEAFPMGAEDMARAHAAFPHLAALSAPLVEAWAAGARQIVTDALHLTVIVGDARETLAGWEGGADAWFLDGFAPAKNPELWEPALMHQVARRTAPGGTAATYTAAGRVRRALQEAGFRVERVPGFGRKRHMTRAVLA
ncbi:tRNA (5-methylaminomethyl-2-thiouridine)(34)-methyltransferase MnmD [Tranquillimonas alkanivorans]|uniref:tRNA U34 5-methylaminomethyl-2-thiouridine-forming methyltransferase MnmC n=1 Tax=Tranquillimonas alkanivorans TaxID=441119 RepID=A0A1I5PK94_9RHOB|nr:tRNA (5-methylaminomethyl-2-thiouridine)(34)-methyltransferase MnmD [Tranquillimonas alkanivorans]SFP34277.1 tRNA U34 5-methylaminomethyl-2-thiouridine-forming methyltransferase MnmC [Tranquillimonas alkanivorans]